MKTGRDGSVSKFPKNSGSTPAKLPRSRRSGLSLGKDLPNRSAIMLGFGQVRVAQTLGLDPLFERSAITDLAAELGMAN